METESNEQRISEYLIYGIIKRKYDKISTRLPLKLSTYRLRITKIKNQKKE